MKPLDLKAIDTNTLNEIARMAWGSSEKANGGRGYMGVIKDEQGKLRVIKYDTHFFKSSSANTKDVKQLQAAQSLRDILVEIAGRKEGMTEDALNEIKNKLGIEGDGVEEPPRDLLSRKVVASVVKMIDENIWANAIDSKEISSYSSAHYDALFSQVEKGGVEGIDNIRREVVSEKSGKQRQDIRNGIECLQKEIENIDPAWFKSYFDKVMPTAAQELKKAEEALKQIEKLNQDSLDDDLKTLADALGLDAKEKNTLKSLVENAIKSEDSAALNDEIENNIKKKLLKKWTKVNEEYEAFYCKMGLVKTSEIVAKNIDTKIAAVTIRKVAWDYNRKEQEQPVSVERFKAIAQSDDPVESLREKFGCSLDDLEGLEELGQKYSKACGEAKAQFEKVKSSLSTRGGDKDKVAAMCENLEKNFGAKLDSLNRDVVLSLGSLANQLSEIPGMIDKYLENHQVEDLLAKDLDQLLSLKEVMQQEAEAIQKINAQKASFNAGKVALTQNLETLGGDLGKWFKILAGEKDPDYNKIDGHIRSFHEFFTNVLEKANDASRDMGLLKNIPEIYKNLNEISLTQFLDLGTWLVDTIGQNYTADSVSEIQQKVKELCEEHKKERAVYNMERSLYELGQKLKSDVVLKPKEALSLLRNDSGANVNDIDERSSMLEISMALDEVIDKRISALVQAFKEKLDKKTSTDEVDRALKEINNLSPSHFLRFTVEELVKVDTYDVQDKLTRFIAGDSIRSSLDKLGENIKGELKVTELPSELQGKIDELNAIFNHDWGDIMMNDTYTSVKDRIKVLEKIPAAAFLSLPVLNLAGKDKDVLEVFVAAQEKLFGEKLQNEEPGSKVVKRLNKFVSDLATKLAKKEVSVSDAVSAVNVIAKLPLSAIVEIEDLHAALTDPEIRPKAVDALKHEIFGTVDEQSKLIVDEHGGADVVAFINSGALGAKGDGYDWGVVLKNLANSMAKNCQGWSSVAAVRFAVNQYTMSSASLRAELPGQYTKYQDLLLGLNRQIIARANRPSVFASLSYALKGVVQNSYLANGFSEDIGKELIDVINLVDALCGKDGKVGAFDEKIVEELGYDPNPDATKENVLGALGALKEKLVENSWNDRTDKAAVRNAANLLETAIKEERSFRGMQAFGKVLEEFKELSPHQFASLREVDIQDIRRGEFKLHNLLTRAENIRSKIEGFKPQFESAINRLFDRLRNDPKYETANEKDIEILRRRLESRLVTVEKFANDADDLIQRSRRDLAVLQGLDFKSFVAYSRGTSSMLFNRLDYLMKLEDRLDAAAKEVKEKFGQDKIVDVRIAALKKHLDAYVLWDAEGISDTIRSLKDEDNLFANVAKGKFVEMSEKDFDTMLYMLTKIHELRTTEIGKPERRHDVDEIVDVTRHLEAGLLNGSMTAKDVNHRLEWLSKLPSEVVQGASWLSQGRTTHAGDKAKHASDVLKALAEKTTDVHVRDRLEAFASSFEELLYDKELVVRSEASEMIEVINDWQEKGVPLSRIFKCETMDQLRQTVWDINAVGKVFDWIGKQVEVELAASPVKDETIRHFGAFKASVMDALLRGDTTLTVDSVNSRLNGILDVLLSDEKARLSNFVNSWLVGKDAQSMLENFRKECDKIVKGAKPKRSAPGASSLDNLTLKIQQEPDVDSVLDAFLYALKQYEKNSPYLRNEATPSERIHFREFIQHAPSLSDYPRIDAGYGFVQEELGMLMAGYFLPNAVNCSDFDNWRHSGFKHGEPIASDIFEKVFISVSKSLDDVGVQNRTTVKKVKANN